MKMTWICDDCGLTATHRMGLIPWLRYGIDSGRKDPFGNLPCPDNQVDETVNLGHYYISTTLHPVQNLVARLHAEKYILESSTGLVDYVLFTILCETSDRMADSYEHYHNKVGLSPLMSFVVSISRHGRYS